MLKLAIVLLSNLVAVGTGWASGARDPSREQVAVAAALELQISSYMDKNVAPEKREAFLEHLSRAADRRREQFAATEAMGQLNISGK